MKEQRLFGLRFASETTLEPVLATLLGTRQNHAPEWRVLVTPNVDHLVRYAHHPTDRQVAERATIVLPDGAPVIWASRLIGRPLPARLTGADLFAALWPRLAAARRSIVVVAANDDIADALRADHPLARVVVPPQFDADDALAIDAIAREIHARVVDSNAEFVLLGVSMPKHHRLCAALTGLEAPASAPWVLLLGASAEFHVGVRRRAPHWMQRFGLEWLHRLLSDPRHMARRYLIDDMAFVPLVWREYRDTHRRVGGGSTSDR